MFARLQLDEGCSVPLHSHENEQLSFVISGALRFTVGDRGETVTVRSGQLLHLPSGVPHAAIAIEDTDGIDVFSPPREDWIAGTDDYLRR